MYYNSQFYNIRPGEYKTPINNETDVTAPEQEAAKAAIASATNKYEIYNMRYKGGSKSRKHLSRKRKNKKSYRKRKYGKSKKSRRFRRSVRSRR